MKRHIGPVSYMTSAENFAGLSKAPEKEDLRSRNAALVDLQISGVT